MNANPLAIPERLTFEDWAEGLRRAVRLHGQLPWMIGDWMDRGYRDFGEPAWQIIGEFETQYSYSTVQNMLTTSRAFPPEERSVDIPWTWYQSMAVLVRAKRKDECDAIITRALKGEMNRQTIRAEVKRLLGNEASPTVGNGAKIALNGSQGPKRMVGEGLAERLEHLSDLLGNAAAVVAGAADEASEHGTVTAETLGAVQEAMDTATAAWLAVMK